MERDSLTPILKWPGGKRNIAGQIIEIFPGSFKTYFEPFLGGGAIFFRLQPDHAVISDNNADLISCYGQIRDNPHELIEVLSSMKNTAEDYYRIRQSRPTSALNQAARFIYLASLSFNGIYRVNLKGDFNVPYGHKTHVVPSDDKKIYAISNVLKNARLMCCDFETALTEASEGDLIYLDPPYTVAHGNNGFVKYNAKIFSWQDQTRLANLAHSLADRGCHVVVSNADHESVRALYPDFNIDIIERTSRIAATSKHRRLITECVFHSRRA